MLGDTAVAVNAADERYTHLHGRSVLLPLMKREIPIILDEIAKPEFGTGAVKITPAHDPNDFEAGKRHGLPQIDVMDLHARMNENAGPYKGLDRYAAREAVLADLKEQGFLVAEKDYTVPLGKCDRCGAVVEPRLSEQWFVKIAPLAKKAIAAVESGEITITPENYKQIYLNWMYNIHDWTISRQLWWGHRIPVWHCGDCADVIVARETPVTCPKCGGAKLEQDTDVLDTWFSSGLLPFTTLGWPEKTRDLEVFYPTTLLITAYEILFFWVARMIMFGCHFMEGHAQDPAIKKASGWAEKKDDSVPFRNVYIHALVRDAQGEKMSKVKGNVINPLDVIDRFGTDATRFTLAAMAAPGTDIGFSESRTAGYRNFANKIWNAARFMFMNVDRIDSGLRPDLAGGITGAQASLLEDRWILSRFNRAAADVNASLQTYRFDEAATRIYDFFWGDFCDWYIELIKPRLNFEEGADTSTARIACSNLVHIFDASLRLLHPVMPFITEEIWHAMYDGAPPLKSIALATYPAADEKQIDLAAETEMAILQDLIVCVRNLRAELKVEPKVKVPIEVFAHEPEIRAMLEKNLGAVLQDRPANVETITFVERSLGNLPGARSTSRFDVHAIYEKKIDVAAERERLTKELEKIEKQLAGAQTRLGDEQFLSKAPGHVVDGLRKQVADGTVLREKVVGKLKELT
jgi:valyl-tRNA synthetase